MGFVIMRFLLYLAVVVLVVSCKTTKYVPVPYEVKSTEYVNKEIRDSIYMRDSIYLALKGDTVLLEKWHTKYIERLRVDTLMRCDSIPVPYEVVTERVRNELNLWQKIIQAIGYLALGFITGFIIYKVKRR